MVNLESQILKTALEWHIDAGADMALLDRPQIMAGGVVPVPESDSVKSPVQPGVAASVTNIVPLGASEARQAAIAAAQAAETLDALRAAIAGFDGIGLRGTATNMVFADGVAGARVMVIGDAPGAEEDRAGKPFAGPGGVLFDAIMASIGFDRTSIYISNLLNWRPPGNRTPTPAEIEISLPFIERHIQLAQPRLLVLMGGVTAKGLLNSEDGLSRLRGRWFDYTPRFVGQGEAGPIPALVTYHPAYLLQSPAQKRAVWADMLMLKAKAASLVQDA